MIFNYLSAMFSIKTNKNSHFSSPQVLLNQGLPSVHVDLLKYCNTKSYDTALIFNNEILLIRELEDINANQIAQFLLGASQWDMLIIGINTLSDVTPVEGYSRIYKLNDSATFHTEYGYIASKEFMAKAANNDLSSINVYIYTPTFMTNTSEVSSNNKYIVTHADHVSIANAEHVEYRWHPISIK